MRELRAKTDEFRQRIQERLAKIADEPDAIPTARSRSRRNAIWR